MVKQVTSYRSNNGKDFNTEHDALREELRHTLVASEKINEASASAFVDWACTPRERLLELAEMFKRLHDTHPDIPSDGKLPNIIIDEQGYARYEPVRSLTRADAVAQAIKNNNRHRV